MTSSLMVERPRTRVHVKRTPGYRQRRQPSRPLAWARLQRGFMRQAPLIVLVTLVIAGAGTAYDVNGGRSAAAAALYWLPLAFAASLLAALVGELGRNTVTSLSSLGKHRGYAVLGAAPELTDSMLRELSPDQRTALGSLAYQPASPFATAFRDLQGALAEESLVAFIGSIPGEGATTSALSTAVSATQQGRNVIIVDCDIRRRSLTKGFGVETDLGVLEACERPDFWADYVEQEGEIGVHFLPAATPASPWRSLVGEAGFPVLLKELRKAYDLVILDCPPALTSAEGQHLARMADKAVVVAVWDRTPLGVIRKVVTQLRAKSRTTTGVYVNRVPRGYRFGRLRPD